MAKPITIASIKNTPSNEAYNLSVDIRVLEKALQGLYRNGAADTSEWDDTVAECEIKIEEWEALTGVEWEYLA